MARKRKAEESRGASAEAQQESKSKPESLYEVLGVEKTASHNDIRKAYHRMALQLHPDKNPGDESAKEKFQTLQKVFGVLGDPEKRRIYDETGATDDAELSGEAFDSLYQYYRSCYPRVTVEDIERFEEEYRGSVEELKDLKELYNRFKGDMKMVLEWMMCARESVDSHRFKDALEAAAKAGELKSYKVFKQWAAEVAKKPAPKAPLKPSKSRAKLGTKASPGGELVAVIKSRQAARAQSLFDSLAEKYGGAQGAKKRSAGPKRKAVAAPEISEEEFSRLQAKVLKGKKAA